MHSHPHIPPPPTLTIIHPHLNLTLTLTLSVAEPCVVLVLSDPPRYTSANLIPTDLARAVRYLSTYQTSDIEGRAVKLNIDWKTSL